MLTLIRREPALVTGIVLALIGVASAFGLGITSGQSDAIVSLVGAVLAILGAGVTRSQVTPVAKLRPATRTADGAHEVTDVPPPGATKID